MKIFQQLHWRILTGLVLGLLYGIAASEYGWINFTQDWIAPWGEVFINSLKLIAVPLVLASLITGVASLSDVKKLSRMGGKTIAIYMGTTAVALVIGLALVNLIKPGAAIPENIQQSLIDSYQSVASDRQMGAEAVKERGPLQPIVDMVPSNLFSSVADNRAMLQVVFFAILFGIGLIQVSRERARPMIEFFQSLNDVVIRIVDIIMLIAPFGVFALVAKTLTSFSSDGESQLFELLGALGIYCLTVILGLTVHMFLFLPMLLKTFSPMKVRDFFKGLFPAQLLGFSTSSSGATLPVTMERCEEKLGVSEEVSSFVLPLGATINMDGTGLYQAVAAVFIAQAMGIPLDLGAQLSIVFTALLASVGTAAVPGAGIIMLIVILESVGVPSGGIALILGVDRLLDMLRTVTNITGDAVVATVVASSEKQLGPVCLDENSDGVKWSR